MAIVVYPKTRFAIECNRYATSTLGAACALLKDQGEVITYPSYSAAQAACARINSTIYSPHIEYRVVVLQ